MIVSFILLFVLQTPSTATTRPVVEIESHKLSLRNKPQLGSQVTAVYEVTPRISKKDLTVVFYGFRGVKPVNKNTVFHFDAKKGIPRKFTIDVEYFSTPATFWAGIRGAYNPLAVTRYLINAQTGEYGTMKEIQFQTPIEYRFNPHSLKFEQDVFHFENERWNKNREIIDTITTIAPKLSDSLALLLYSEIHNMIYPEGISKWPEKVRYLVEQGWQGYTKEVDRQEFLMKLKAENEAAEAANEEKRKKLELEAQAGQRSRTVKWLLSWLIPTILLSFLLIGLLAVRARRRSKAVTSKQFDKIITYSIYVTVIGFAVYLAWPYLGLKSQAPRKISKIYLKQNRKVEDRKILSDIKETGLLENFNDFGLVSKSTFTTKAGIGADFVYKDNKHSAFGVEYFFTVKVWPTSEGNTIRQPVYSPITAIQKFEQNNRVTSFLTRNEVKKAQLNFADSLFSVTVNDSVIRYGVTIPFLLEYDGRKDIITTFIVPADFEDESFPEIKMLSKICASWGHRIRKDFYIKGVRRFQNDQPHLKTVVENSGSDTLHLWFYSEKCDNYTYYWDPVPNAVEPPQPIIDLIYSEFSKAGLQIEYAKKYIKAISSRAFRKPDYFSYDEKDRAIVEATFKWITGADWVDNMNNNEGARFTVVYEYFSNSLKLGRALGKPETKGIQRVWKQIAPRYYRLRPIKQIISNKEARRRLFETLPDGVGFNTIYVKLNIPEAPADCNNFICLVGNYTPQGADYSFDVMVDLETGEVLEAKLSRGWRWTEYEIPQKHSYPYD